MEQGVQLKYMILEATLLTTALCRIFWGHRGRQATQLRAEREGEKEELLEFSLSSVLVISNTPPPTPYCKTTVIFYYHRSWLWG